MGYASLNPLSQIELQSNNVEGTLSLNTVAADLGFGQGFDIPQWILDQARHIYLLVECPKVVNSSAAGGNFAHASSIQISADGGATWHDALTIIAGFYNTNTSETAYEYFRYLGTHDLITYGFTSGTTASLQWHDAHAARDNLVLWNVRCSLIFELGS